MRGGGGAERLLNNTTMLLFLIGRLLWGVLLIYRFPRRFLLLLLGFLLLDRTSRISFRRPLLY